MYIYAMRACDEEYLALADKQAKKSIAKQQMGAILVRQKEILSKGFNRNVSLYKVLTRYGLLYSIHAEMDALRKLPYGKAKGATIYVSRAGFRMSKPCEFCMPVLKYAGITRIVYSLGNGQVDIIKL
jgi:deoxycytidylate deaminase